MQGNDNGRVDRARRGPNGLLYLVSLIAWAASSVAVGDSVTIVQTYDHGSISSGEVSDACEAHQGAYDTGDPDINKNTCGGLDGADDAFVDTTDLSYKSEVWTTYGAPTGEDERFYWLVYESGCPEGTTEQPDGTCEEACTQGETITGMFDGTGLSVCDGSCNYTTTHGYDGDSDSGSYVWDSNGYGSSNMPQRYGVWVNDGTSCSSGVAAQNSITTDQGTTLDHTDEPTNCGTMNGERFCAPSLPESGKCVLVGSNGYVCGNAGDQSVVPPHDPSTTTVTENDAVTADGANGEGTAITLSAGTIDTSTPSDGLDEGTTTPEAGTEEAKEDDPTFCENNPEMCDLDDGLGDGPEVPEETFDLSTMTDNYSSGISNTAECPATETIAVFGTDFSFPWTSFCDFADLIRPFVIAAGFLAAFLFAVRALA